MPSSAHFQNEKQVIDRIALLRGGYRKTGNWTLAQICWHVSLPIERHLAPPIPMDLQPTPEQTTIKRAFVDYIIEHGAPPPHAKNAPPSFIPPVSAGETDIERYLSQLERLRSYPHPKVLMGPVGPVTIGEFRICNLTHAAHHLAFLVPVSRRANLAFTNEDEVIADVRSLREGGFVQTGSWTLGQICWHLDVSLKSRMVPGPFPAETSDQAAARGGRLPEVISTGRLPEGITAPDALVPPAGAADEAIDSLIATLRRFKSFSGPIAPHRIFGQIPDPEARQLAIIHCAHHLSHLVPNVS